MMVPPVTEVCLPQPADSQAHGWVCKAYAFVVAAGAHKAVGPARREQIPDAGRFIRKALLKLDQ
jgi:hypothetical protein